MNLVLRPLSDVNDVTWSIIWCLVILLAGVAYYIYTILTLAYEELKEDYVEESSPVSHCGTDGDAIHNHNGNTDSDE